MSQQRGLWRELHWFDAAEEGGDTDKMLKKKTKEMKKERKERKKEWLGEKVMMWSGVLSESRRESEGEVEGPKIFLFFVSPSFSTAPSVTKLQWQFAQ